MRNSLPSDASVCDCLLFDWSMHPVQNSITQFRVSSGTTEILKQCTEQDFALSTISFNENGAEALMS
jgi:hypothetical protein